MDMHKDQIRKKHRFKNYLSVEKALKVFLESCRGKNNISNSAEEVTLTGALNRVLAQNLFSPIEIPPFDRSAMDGYALLFQDTKGASSKNHVSLKMIGKIYAGERAAYSIKSGQCVSVATGARIPENADTVVMVEDTCITGPNTVKILNQTKRGKNISLKGEDIKKNQILLRKGTWLGPQDIGIIASVGISKISVQTRPRVAIFTTGNELVEPGAQLDNDGKIFESNGHMVSCMVNNWGGDAINLGICADNREEIAAKLKECLDYDVVVVSGGSSVGELDFVPDLVTEMGKPGLLVRGVAMKPGSPTSLGLVKRVPIIVVPGFPVSAFFALYTFGKPLLQDILGINGTPEGKVTAKMTKAIKLHDGVRTFLRVKLVTKRDNHRTVHYFAEPVSATGASLLSTLIHSDGFIIVDKKNSLRKGEKVNVTMLRNNMSFKVNQ
jgi:molybdenum cofactor synthesis domain-containing protein